MGCGLTKEKIQTDILVLLLEKAEIQEERERLIHQLKLLNKKRGYSLPLSPSNNFSNSRKLSTRYGSEDTE